VKILIAVLLLMLVALQWRLWFGDGGLHEVKGYRKEVIELTDQLDIQKDVNSALHAEVLDLKEGTGEIEARSRSELGMIEEGETFYQFVGDKKEIEPDNDNLAGIAIDSKPVQ